MQKTIVCVCNDIGGMNAVLPVYKALKLIDKSAILAAYGKSLERLSRGLGQSFRYYPSPGHLLADGVEPAGIVTSACAADGLALGRELINFFGKDLPTLAIEDFWASRLLNGDWEPPFARPRYFLVNDELGASCVKKAWGYNDWQIEISGFPALDAFFGLDMENERRNIGKRMKIEEREKVVLYASSGIGAGTLLGKVVEALNKFSAMGGIPLTFIPREHPMMRSLALEEVPFWDAALGKFAAGRLIADTGEVNDINHILPRADLVISHFSTALVSASALRKPNIAFLESVASAYFMERTSGLLDDFPLVPLGCTAKAANVEDLARLVAKNFETGLGLEAAQTKIFRADGQNAARAADFICGLT